MVRKIRLQIFTTFVVLFVFALPLKLYAKSFETNWQGSDKSQLRLIAAKAAWRGKKHLFAGIDIRLAPKWKTYWRTPGDTGIPPYFDWAGSENLLKAEVLYPVPHWFEDAAGQSIGYKSRVTLPVVITPKDPLLPVVLKLNASYAICYDLCVPISTQQSLKIDDGLSSPFVPVMEMALLDIPKQVAKRRADIGVNKVGFIPGDKSALSVLVNAPETASKVELFIEGPGGLYVPSPKLLSRGSGEDKFTYLVDLSGMDDPKKFKGIELVCTLRVDDKAIVQPCLVE